MPTAPSDAYKPALAALQRAHPGLLTSAGTADGWRATVTHRTTRNRWEVVLLHHSLHVQTTYVATEEKAHQWLLRAVRRQKKTRRD